MRVFTETEREKEMENKTSVRKRVQMGERDVRPETIYGVSESIEIIEIKIYLEICWRYHQLNSTVMQTNK